MNPLSHLSNFTSRKEYEDYIDSLADGLEHPKLSRPEHIVAVYLLGRWLIQRVFGFRIITLNTGTQLSFNYFWKYISLFHDIGYGPQYQKEANFNKYNSNLLRNNYLGHVYDANNKCNQTWLRSYNRDELEFYYAYWEFYGRQYCINHQLSDGYELYEHGILGGYLFSELFHNRKPSSFKGSIDDWNDLVLAVALIIAQHNIWPVEGNFLETPPFNAYDGKEGRPLIDKAKFTKKHVNFSFHIDLLSFAICLIDSIDIVKKFYGERKEDGYEYIEDYDVLCSVLNVMDFKVKQSEKQTHIIINGCCVKNELAKHFKEDIYDKWISNLRGSESFLDIKTNESNGLITITFNRGNKRKGKESNSIFPVDIIIFNKEEKE